MFPHCCLMDYTRQCKSIYSISKGKLTQHNMWSSDYSVKDLDWNTTFESMVRHGLYFDPTACIMSLSHSCKTDFDGLKSGT